MYRPTVRMDDQFRQYIDQLFHVTTLDRNQIIRMALFVSPYSGLFRQEVEKHMQGGKRDCPPPPWTLSHDRLWKVNEL